MLRKVFLHALNENEENKVIESYNLKKWTVFSENRSVKSDLMGKHEVISKDMYGLKEDLFERITYPKSLKGFKITK